MVEPVSEATHRRPAPSMAMVAISTPLLSGTVGTVARCDQNWYVPGEPGTYWIDARRVDPLPSYRSTCATSPAGSTSALPVVRVLIRKTGFQVVSSSRHTHVPELLGNTLHHLLACFQTLLCGFSPVFWVVDTGLSCWMVGVVDAGW